MPESTTSFVVETEHAFGRWESCWTEDGKPLEFSTDKQAREAIKTHLSALKQAGMQAERLRVAKAPSK